jgi:uncharacterized ParB-like nuclease family protein
MQKFDIIYEEIEIRNIRESELNPQVMKKLDFNRLVKNIKKDGILTSAPLLMRQEEKKYICISGHHRIKAAIKAGLKKIICAITSEVDISTRLRLQLIHNDIHREPDPEVVKLLQQKISKEDLKLCEIMIDQVEKEDEIIEVKLPDFRYINICLLPESEELFKELIDLLSDDDSEKYIVEKEDYQHIKKMLTFAFKNGFKMPGRAFRKFMDIVENHKEEING